MFLSQFNNLNFKMARYVHKKTAIMRLRDRVGRGEISYAAYQYIISLFWNPSSPYSVVLTSPFIARKSSPVETGRIRNYLPSSIRRDGEETEAEK